MKITALTCARCDAPIRVERGQTAVVCGYCESQLVVRERPGDAHTEAVQTILREAESLVREVRALRAERKLKALDRRWDRRRALRRRLRGFENRPRPATPLQMFVVVVGCITGILFVAGEPIVGAACLVGGAILGFAMFGDWKNEEDLRRTYRRRRRRLVAQIKVHEPGNAAVAPPVAGS